MDYNKARLLAIQCKQDDELGGADMDDIQKVERPDDMTTRGKLQLIKQSDGDICINIFEEDYDGVLLRTGVEICNPGSGGGHSPETWKWLHALFDAMKKDSEE